MQAPPGTSTLSRAARCYASRLLNNRAFHREPHPSIAPIIMTCRTSTILAPVRSMGNCIETTAVPLYPSLPSLPSERVNALLRRQGLCWPPTYLLARRVPKDLTVK